ncbi:thermonuclease family protein [Rubinisphaera italica]|uniref:TNase-like domain-containing protein n=1 Tax=Rubinisphaera italica TaxID=2527969 RepID=A0A5C5XLA1_9PLAN|nr:thermonuclease family protein [Rubinisphaera italica]TWT63183.1 hypothetical protein Pan54_39360 [Rubinisphaera italica]
MSDFPKKGEEFPRLYDPKQIRNDDHFVSHPKPLLRPLFLEQLFSCCKVAIGWIFCFVLAFFLALCVSAFVSGSVAAAEPPQTGMVVPCRIVDVYDGDTITIELTIPFKVRLMDCWAPEIRGVDDETKQRGFAARDHLREITAGRAARLEIRPPKRIDSAGDLFSFERIVGRVWLDGDEEDLSRRMVRAGHATKERTDE